MKCTADNIGRKGTRMISEALKINSTLTSLDLTDDRRLEVLKRKKEIERFTKK